MATTRSVVAPEAHLRDSSSALGSSARATMFKRAATALFELDNLVRIHQLGFVAVWPLLGRAAVSDWPLGPFVALLAVSVCFNAYGSVLNDALHRHIDRDDPLKANGWLVRGKLTPAQAVVVAFLPLPIALWVHAVAGFSADAIVWLLAAFVGQAIYNLYCKTCAVPPLIEGAEALAAFSLVLYGATVTPAELTPLVWFTAGAGTAFILVVNAFHSCLRDIETELQSRQRTTAIWLGCRGVHHGAVHISPAMSCYVGSWHAVLIGFSLAAVGETGGSTAATFIARAAIAVSAAVAAALFVSLHWIRKPAWDVIMRLHMLLVPTPIMFAFVPGLGAAQSVLLFVVYLSPSILTGVWWTTRARSQLAINSGAAAARGAVPNRT